MAILAVELVALATARFVAGAGIDDGCDGEGSAVAAAVERLEVGVEINSLLLFAGRPLREPVARSGPFVMSTNDELRQAFEDYRAGRLGT